MKYIPALDGMRAIAILLVVIGHFGLAHIIPGGFGVTIFFFISGLLITKLLLEEFEKNSKIKIPQFYLRRIFRLYPALILFIVCCLTILYFSKTEVRFLELSSTIFYFRNYYLNFYHWQEFFPTLNLITERHFVDSSIFNITWSLAVEEHFYLMYPFVFTFFIKKRRLSLDKILVLSILITLIWRIVILEIWKVNDITKEIIYQGTDTRLDSIAFGCFTSYLIHYNLHNFLKRIDNKFYFTLGIIVIVFSLFFRNDYFRSSVRYSLQGIALMVVIPNIIYNSQFLILRSFLELPIFVYIGKLSYSLYLGHWIGIYSAKQMGLEINTINFYKIAIPIGIAVTLFSYHIVEHFFLRLRKKYGSIAN